MKCIHCGAANPKQSKFCRRCGTSLGAALRCPHCDFNNPGDSLFCITCGTRLSGPPKPVKGTLRKCKSCGGQNELDAHFCVICGEEIIFQQKEKLSHRSSGPSYKIIGLFIGLVLLSTVLIKPAKIFFKGIAGLSPSAASGSKSVEVDEAQVIAVAKNFKCACGKCGELPLATCNCDMPTGSVEEKRFIREKLAEGHTVDQVIDLLDKKYGHRA